MRRVHCQGLLLKTFLRALFYDRLPPPLPPPPPPHTHTPSWKHFPPALLDEQAWANTKGFEQRMIIIRIIKVFLKRKLIYSFKLIYRRGLVSGITSLSMFLLTRSKAFFSLD